MVAGGVDRAERSDVDDAVDAMDRSGVGWLDALVTAGRAVDSEVTACRLVGVLRSTFSGTAVSAGFVAFAGTLTSVGLAVSVCLVASTGFEVSTGFAVSVGEATSLGRGVPAAVWLSGCVVVDSTGFVAGDGPSERTGD